MGGYCTKVGCDLPGNGCAANGKCQRRGVGEAWCLAPCEVGAQEAAVTDPDYLFVAHRDCRSGFACVWDGASAAGRADNGGCLPGQFNSVRTDNIGDDCSDAAECYSPLGLGRCGRSVAGDTRDACYVTDCGAPLPAGTPSLCGDSAACIQFTGSGDTLCRPTCGAASDCGAVEACWNPTGVLPIVSGAAVCLPVCFAATQSAADAQCRPGQSCGAGFSPGTALGRCG